MTIAAPTPLLETPVHKASFAALMLAACAAIAAFTAWQGIDRYPLDDAFIVQHTVNGILGGGESRFLDSTPYDGATSPLFVLLVSALSLAIPVRIAHWAVQAAAALLFVSGAFVIGRQKNLSGPLSAMLAVVAVLSGMTVYQLFNGLETGLAMAAVIWTIVALESAKPPLASYALAGLLCFIRPELAALSGLSFLHFLRMKPSRRPDGWKRGFALAFAAFLAFAALWTILSGSPIPNTISAKQYFFADGCLPLSIKARMMGLVLVSFVSVYGMPSIGFLFLGKARRCGPVLGLFALAFLLAYFLKSPGSISRNGQRYMYVFAPMAVLGLAGVIGFLMEKPGAGAFRKIAFSWGLLAVVAANSAWRLPGRMAFLEDETRNCTDESRAIAKWVDAHVPPGSPILIHDAGMISLVGSHPLVDLVGLKTRYSVGVHRDGTWKTCAASLPRSLHDIALHFGTEYAVLGDQFDAESLLSDSLRKAGWRLEFLSSDLGANRYKAYRLTPPSPAP